VKIDLNEPSCFILITLKIEFDQPSNDLIRNTPTKVFSQFSLNHFECFIVLELSTKVPFFILLRNLDLTDEFFKIGDQKIQLEEVSPQEQIFFERDIISPYLGPIVEETSPKAVPLRVFAKYALTAVDLDLSRDRILMYTKVLKNLSL
tara:strand:- start:1041 stop:1484 length:444 start_codon:yes stop_codon:yes gene_type:complete